MTRIKIVDLAREAGWDFNSIPSTEWLIRFAALIRAHERNVCIKICDDYAMESWQGHMTKMPKVDAYTSGLSDGADNCSALMSGSNCDD